MRLLILLIFLVLIVVLVGLHIVWLAVFLCAVFVVLALGSAGIKTYSGAKSAGKGLWGDMQREYQSVEQSEGQYPSGAVVQQSIKGVSDVTNELIAMRYGGRGAAEKKKVSEIAGKGTKNMVDFFKKLFG